MLGSIPQTISHCPLKMVALAHPPHLPFHYSAAQVGICVRTILFPTRSPCTENGQSHVYLQLHDSGSITGTFNLYRGISFTVKLFSKEIFWWFLWINALKNISFINIQVEDDFNFCKHCNNEISAIPLNPYLISHTLDNNTTCRRLIGDKAV